MDEQGRGNAAELSAGSSGGDGALEGRKSLVEFLLEKKILKYKDSEVELEFSPIAFIPAISEQFESKEDMDELLYFSAPSRPGGN